MSTGESPVFSRQGPDRQVNQTFREIARIEDAVMARLERIEKKLGLKEIPRNSRGGIMGPDEKEERPEDARTPEQKAYDKERAKELEKEAKQR